MDRVIAPAARRAPRIRGRSESEAPTEGSEHPLESRLRVTAEELFGDDAARITLGGKLLRPRFTLSGGPRGEVPAPSGDVVRAALAIQMAHEASLLHDDVVDGASTRRDRPAVPARDGTAAALIAGDRLLTMAYRAAASVGSPSFFHRFSLAVDQTVAGEARQGALRGRVLTLGEYRTVIEAKSGALFGIALAADPLLSPALAGVDGRAPEVEVETAYALGIRIGALYQMVDDLLDYCPAVNRGKPSLTDFRQGKWTLPLAELGHPSPFDLSEDAVVEELLGGDPTAVGPCTSADRPGSPLRRALRCLEEEAVDLVHALETHLSSSDEQVEEILSWARMARAGVRTQENARTEWSSTETRVRDEARAVGTPQSWPDFFGRHSRSFHFAAGLFPSDFRERITGIYAFCRFTDDLVDETTGPGGPRRETVRDRLDAWRSLVRASHAGAGTGVPLLDRVVRPAGDRGIPLSYLDGLLDGVEMDVDAPEYPDLEALRVYTHRVASVVGGWITEELGVRDPGILDRAFALGHAMQMTNILRDVGEDLRAGRLYLPLDRLAAHGLVRSDLEAAARGLAPVPPGYPDLMEELMAHADGEYRFARTGLSALPFRARSAVAVASRVYRGIHAEIRTLGYDSLTRRAHTGRFKKLGLGGVALLSLIPPGRRP